MGLLTRSLALGLLSEKLIQNSVGLLKQISNFQQVDDCSWKQRLSFCFVEVDADADVDDAADADADADVRVSRRRSEPKLGSNEKIGILTSGQNKNKLLQAIVMTAA